MKKYLFILIGVIYLSGTASAQFILYEDQFHGGVTGGSFSSGVSGVGSGFIVLHIDPTSTIRKAYLMVGRLGTAVPVTVNLNSMVLTFDTSNQVTPDFNCALYGGISAVHAIDITSQVSPLVNVYSISYNQFSTGANFFTDFYLYVAYENNSMPTVSTVVFLKTLDFMATENYTLNLAYPVDTLVPIGFAMHAGYMCNNTADAENITVAGTLLGNIGGGDPNDPPNICAGTSGSFYYENNVLYGLNGDSADQVMASADALSDISHVVPNGAAAFDVEFEHVGGPGSSPDNSMWGWILAYGNSNVQPVALFTSPNHICPGTCTDFTNNSLNATSFTWIFAGASPGVSTDVNPVSICYNTPGQYDVTLIASNSNGTDTLQLHNYITVYPFPPPQGIIQSGDTLFANPGAVSYQWYYSGNAIPGATDYFYVAQGSGDYNVVATDANGCEVEAAIFDVVAAIQEDAGHQPEFYPNPVTDQLSVGGLPGTGYKISLSNLLGEQVNAPVAGNKSLQVIDFSQLSSGVYFIEIISGEQVLRKKIIKSVTR